MVNQNLNIVESLESDAYFRPAFKNLETWRNWITLLKTLFALEMTDEEKEFFFKCTGRNIAPKKPPSSAFLCIGRKGGKSRISALISVYLAIFRDWSASLSRGETGWIFIVAADRSQARNIFGYIREFLRLDAFKDYVESETASSIRLQNNIGIEVRTANFRSIRGYTVCAAILDELAFWRSEESANPDYEILTALEPCTATVEGSLILGISTPFARRGVLWEAYHEYFGKDDSDDVLVWRASSIEMNPTMHLKVKKLFTRDKATFNAEYNAMFREDIESYLPIEIIEAITDFGRRENAYNSGTRYFGFVDASGGRADSMCLAIAHKLGEDIIIDRAEEEKPPFSPETVVAKFCYLMKMFNIRSVVGDAYGANWVSKSFEKQGISYKESPLNKSELYIEFQAIASMRRVRLPDNEHLRIQLQNLERKPGKQGRDVVEHPMGVHDDIANVCAGSTVIAFQERIVTAEQMEKLAPRIIKHESRQRLLDEIRGKNPDEEKKRRSMEEEEDAWAKSEGWSRIIKPR